MIILIFNCNNQNKISETENKEKITINEVSKIISTNYEYYCEQDGIVLTGFLYTYLTYGPPNYGENPETDSKEYPYILKLQKNISVGVLSDDKMSEPTIGNEVHLAPMGENIHKYLHKNLSNHITVKGSLFFHHTGHHRRPIMFSVSEIIK